LVWVPIVGLIQLALGWAGDLDATMRILVWVTYFLAPVSCLAIVVSCIRASTREPVSGVALAAHVLALAWCVVGLYGAYARMEILASH
jgi:hypothetical protein